MLKYYEWLLRIREYVKNTFGLDILQNLEDYPLDQDESLNEYYEKIAYQLEHMRYSDRTPSDRFYVQKSKPFFSGGKIYYEITVIPADDYSSKFNRFTAVSYTHLCSPALKTAWLSAFCARAKGFTAFSAALFTASCSIPPL